VNCPLVDKRIASNTWWAIILTALASGTPTAHHPSSLARQHAGHAEGSLQRRHRLPPKFRQNSPMAGSLPSGPSVCVVH